MLLEAHRVGQGVEGERVVGRSFDAEEVDLRAQPEHEVVVAQRLELVEGHLALLEIDAGDPILVDAHVVLLVEEVADRMADRRLLEQPRRDLVEERLEGVVVVLVHEHDVDVALLQLLRGADPGKAAAEDEDTRSLAVLSSGHGAKLVERRPTPLIRRG